LPRVASAMVVALATRVGIVDAGACLAKRAKGVGRWFCNFVSVLYSIISHSVFDAMPSHGNLKNDYLFERCCDSVEYINFFKVSLGF